MLITLLRKRIMIILTLKIKGNNNSVIYSYYSILFYYYSGDQISSILSETKGKVIGVLNVNEEKLLELRFLAIKNGFNSLGVMTITDQFSRIKFQIIHPNKIYVD